MDKYKETFQTWNKVAYLYQDKFMDLEMYNESYDFVCNSVGKNKAKVLDIGCGPGNISKYLLSKRPDFDILGIDVASNMIELAKKNNPSANFAVMDCREIDSIKNQFDAIICGFCLPYLSESDVEKFLQDCYNLLNKNGLLYISFVEGDPKKSDFQTSSTGNRAYFYFHDINELKNQLSLAGFTEPIVFNVTYKRSENEMEIHTILIVRK
ncbi:MAG: class I SAM-dependent methyltransferase [Flavobacteriaceae bacterium]|nr:class I SAM-dependent methyltransferase [Flavobacteriaceae bacterium]